MGRVACSQAKRAWEVNELGCGPQEPMKRVSGLVPIRWYRERTLSARGELPGTTRGSWGGDGVTARRGPGSDSHARGRKERQRQGTRSGKQHRPCSALEETDASSPVRPPDQGSLPLHRQASTSALHLPVEAAPPHPLQVSLEPPSGTAPESLHPLIPAPLPRPSRRSWRF